MSWSSVEFLETGDDYLDALLEEFARARRSVLFESYIFCLDRAGLAVLEALCACQRRGVKVFLRLDGVGAREQLPEISDYCGKNSLELEIFHPLPFAKAGKYFPVGFAKVDGFLTRWKLMNRRTHRKLAIIDDTIAFVGGRNIEEAQFERFRGEDAWHDLTVRLEGSGVDDLVQAFWFRPARHFRFEDCLLNYSWRLRQARNAWISARIAQAKSRVWIITPYFAPPPAMLYQLRQASRRGLDIRLILTRESDVAVSRLAALGLYSKLLSWGIRIFEYEPSILHRKLWVIDSLSLVGSGNFNHRSFIHDLELDVIFKEPAWSQQAEQLFVHDQRLSSPVNRQFLEGLGFWKRMLSWMAGWFTYWL